MEFGSTQEDRVQKRKFSLESTDSTTGDRAAKRVSLGHAPGCGSDMLPSTHEHEVEAVMNEWAELQQLKPPNPKGTPTVEQLQALRAFKVYSNVKIKYMYPCMIMQLSQARTQAFLQVLPQDLRRMMRRSKLDCKTSKSSKSSHAADTRNLEYVVGLQDDGLRLRDIAIRVFPSVVSGNQAKKLIKVGVLGYCRHLYAAIVTAHLQAGNIKINGEPVDRSHRVKQGTAIQLSTADVAETVGHWKDPDAYARHFGAMSRAGLRVVLQTNTFAAVFKPAGYHTTSAGRRSIDKVLHSVLAKAQSEDAMLPKPVHRLDSRVCGIVLCAKTRQAAVHLSRQFELKQVRKRYRAIVAGQLVCDGLGHILSNTCDCGSKQAASIDQFTDAQQVVEEFLGPTASPSVTALIDWPVCGRSSLTIVQVVGYTPCERTGWLTTVNLYPLTGRKHQLRAHLALLGHPIIGDDLYPDASAALRYLGSADFTADDPVDESISHEYHNEIDQAQVVRKKGLFLQAIATAFVSNFTSTYDNLRGIPPNVVQNLCQDVNHDSYVEYDGVWTVLSVPEATKFENFRTVTRTHWERRHGQSSTLT